MVSKPNHPPPPVRWPGSGGRPGIVQQRVAGAPSAIGSSKPAMALVAPSLPAKGAPAREYQPPPVRWNGAVQCKRPELRHQPPAITWPGPPPRAETLLRKTIAPPASKTGIRAASNPVRGRYPPVSVTAPVAMYRIAIQMMQSNYNTHSGVRFPIFNQNDYSFTLASALEATTPVGRGDAKKISGLDSESGVEVGDVGSYKIIQHLEKKGDNLTGDHQPSGAAIKEAIRLELHRRLNQVLTRAMA